MIDKLLLEKYAVVFACLIGGFLVAKEVYLFGPDVFISIAFRVLIAIGFVIYFAPKLIDWLSKLVT